MCFQQSLFLLSKNWQGKVFSNHKNRVGSGFMACNDACCLSLCHAA